VLRNGYHERIKDTWDEKFYSWNYSIKGKTVDRKPCRIIVNLDVNGLLIITVIRLSR
jgi:hypothetical protein